MATVYTPDSLRNLFQSSFNLAQWYNFLQHFFNASELKEKPERIIENTSDEGYYLGNIDTPDSYRIGLFQYNIVKGSVANKRVGLRNLVKSFINPTWGEFDAALVVFDSGDHWRLSFICDIKGETTSPKRYTYVFGSDDLLYRTPIERFNFLKKKGISFENLKTAFSVEALSDEFFDRYREQYANFIQYVTGKRVEKSGNKWVEREVTAPNATFMQAFDNDEKRIRDYIKKLMGRITFLHFLQRKGWMNGDLNYMQNMFENSSHKDDYLDSVLEPLFFGILNTKPLQRIGVFEQLGWDKSLLAEWKDIPYLNGGLFERDEEDEPESRFPAEYFKRLFQFFSEYNFTIDENDPNDAEVGVDPEMLGKIFENLLEDNKDKGAFYTPKEIVRYMCQESLIAYLETNTSIAKEKIRQFVLSPEEGIVDIPENKKPKLLTALEEVKICDPAIGSGAFPMGLLNELLHCREVLSGEHYDRAEIKKSIIQNNIYGVDIEKGAVDIARLRFWLSIVVDEDTPSPLPNLDYKIMQGNSLIESFMGVDLSGLTYERQSKRDSGAGSLFDDEKNRLQKVVSDLLREYYSCSDHDSKIKLQQRITDTINAQLEAQNYNPEILRELRTINLAENNNFFLWHTWFSDVFNRDDKEGFDIVIDNPPYVSSKSLSKDYKVILQTNFKFADKQFDLYSLFIELSLKLLTSKGVNALIIPDSFIGRSNFAFPRIVLVNSTKITKWIHINNVFESAEVSSLIYLSINQKSFPYSFTYEKAETVYDWNNGNKLEQLVYQDIINKTNDYKIICSSPEIIRIANKLLSLDKFDNYFIMWRGEELGKRSDAISLFKTNDRMLPILAGDNVKRYELPTINKWIHTYNVNKDIANYRTPKILIRQLGTTINATIDNNSCITLQSVYCLIPMKKHSSEDLFAYLGLLNSKIYRFLYNFMSGDKQTFQRIILENIKSLPMPNVSELLNSNIGYMAKTILYDTNINSNMLEREIDQIVYKLYGLTDAEIKIIEQSI